MNPADDSADGPDAAAAGDLSASAPDGAAFELGGAGAGDPGETGSGAGAALVAADSLSALAVADS